MRGAGSGPRGLEVAQEALTLAGPNRQSMFVSDLKARIQLYQAGRTIFAREVSGSNRGQTDSLTRLPASAQLFHAHSQPTAVAYPLAFHPLPQKAPLRPPGEGNHPPNHPIQFACIVFIITKEPY
jgi:hypothetical protein